MDDRVLRSRIQAREIVLGEGVVIEEGATISGPHGPADRVVLGDHVYIAAHCKIRVPVLEIGDFTQIHNHTLANGYKPLTIGNNGWFGQNCILNATDRLQIGNNCGVGAYSQLWTHIAYGDVLQGCRWNSTAPMTVGEDVWFVGHCIVSPITAHDRAMALVGSVVTRDMEANHVYAGTPARDITDKVGGQFAPPTVEQRVEMLQRERAAFLERNPDVAAELLGIAADGEIVQPGETVFDVVRRTYDKRRSSGEVRFLKFLLPRAKFLPSRA
ncbi:MAG: acyltransferase [Deltaproteobacteria bacterium]|nr:acyltransferase [Deltaproteobacteria bacterium]